MNSSALKSEWPGAPAELRLAEDEVHVWARGLNVSSTQLAEFTEMLCNSEKERAARFRFDVHRDRYIAGRGFLRATLSRYLPSAPAQLEFKYSAHDKPELSGESGADALHFNLAHSGDLALLAVTRIGAIGVDVEAVRLIKDVDDLVTRFFSERENQLFQKLNAEEKPPAFFNLWTRKEALLKATGDGISGGLNRVEVSFLADEPARLLAIGGDEKKAGEWTLYALNPVEGFVGAVAIRARGVRVSTWSGI